MNHSSVLPVQSEEEEARGETERVRGFGVTYSCSKYWSRIRASEDDPRHGLCSPSKDLALGTSSASGQILKWAPRSLQPKVARGLLALALQRRQGS